MSISSFPNHSTYEVFLFELICQRFICVPFPIIFYIHWISLFLHNSRYVFVFFHIRKGCFWERYAYTEEQDFDVPPHLFLETNSEGPITDEMSFNQRSDVLWLRLRNPPMTWLLQSQTISGVYLPEYYFERTIVPMTIPH